MERGGGELVQRVLHTFLIAFVRGTMVVLANQGVAEILIINRKGNNAFVMTYAVANLKPSVSPDTPSIPRLKIKDLSE